MKKRTKSEVRSESAMGGRSGEKMVVSSVVAGHRGSRDSRAGSMMWAAAGVAGPASRK